MKPWIYLSAAIIAEVAATSALKSSDGFTRLVPSLVVVLGYAIAFYFLALSLHFIPLGIAYAVWAGLGIVLIALIGWLVHGQALDLPAIAGMSLIIAGVAVMHLFSRTAGH
ncbi:MAG: SMR family transporter [Gammaproteobacteria bacterium]|jgi:small multidrug resistance pump|nr:SMR family transporter [Gammaproteobacteria bacterium]